MINAKANPLIRLKPTSLINRLKSEPLTASFAKPWTIIAED